MGRQAVLFHLFSCMCSIVRDQWHSPGGKVCRMLRFIYNDLQGRNQKEAVHHIAEQGIATRKAWALASPRADVAGLHHPTGLQLTPAFADIGHV